MSESLSISRAEASPVADTMSTTAEIDIREQDTVEDVEASEIKEKEPIKEEEMYTDKNRTMEDLEKETENALKKTKEYENKIQELEEHIQKQSNEETSKNIDIAKAKGFNSYEEMQIEQAVKIKEFEYLVQNIDKVVSGEYSEYAREALLKYYNTVDVRYLNEAKKYFNPEFLEHVTIEKNAMKNELIKEYQNKQKEEFINKRNNFISSIETSEINKEFLKDLEKNTAKLDSLKVFFHQGLIQTQEDFEVVKTLYSAVEEQAVKDYIAKCQLKKDVKETKEKSIIFTGSSETEISSSQKLPSYEDIKKMTDKDWSKAVEKYGLEKLLQVQ